SLVEAELVDVNDVRHLALTGLHPGVELPAGRTILGRRGDDDRDTGGLQLVDVGTRRRSLVDDDRIRLRTLPDVLDPLHQPVGARTVILLDLVGGDLDMQALAVRAAGHDAGELPPRAGVHAEHLDAVALHLGHLVDTRPPSLLGDDRPLVTLDRPVTDTQTLLAEHLAVHRATLRLDMLNRDSDPQAGVGLRVRLDDVLAVMLRTARQTQVRAGVDGPFGVHQARVGDAEAVGALDALQGAETDAAELRGLLGSG